MFIAGHIVTHGFIRMDISLLRIVIKISPLMVIGYKLILYVLEKGISIDIPYDIFSKHCPNLNHAIRKHYVKWYSEYQ